MKKRFLTLAFALFCLFSLGAHALQIRFEGEDEAIWWSASRIGCM